jgi:phage gpG-like protein
MATMTPDQLKERLQALGLSGHAALVRGMKNGCIGVTRRAKKNCTPGESPYDNMVFPTKVIETTKTGKKKKSQLKFSPNEINRSGAPFNKGDLRRSITYRVKDDGVVVIGTVGTKLSYALPVHDGTSKIEARPFVYDAVMVERENTNMHIIDALDVALLQISEGNLFFNPTQIGFVPTTLDDIGGDE